MTTRPRILALFGARVIFGSERGNIEALAALREQGCDVLCAVRDESWNDHIATALSERGLGCCRVPFIDGWLRGWRLRTLIRNPVAFVRANCRLLRIAHEFQPSHVHAFNPYYVLNFVPALSILRIPIIYRAGDAPLQHRWFWRMMWSYIVARTIRFVAISRFIARQLEATGVRAEKITLIYGRPPIRPNLNEAPEVAGDIRNVVFVGQIAEHKGPQILVEAVSNLAESYPDLRLLIAGPITEWRGHEWARNLRQRVAKDPRLRQRVTFLGAVDNVPGLLRCCDFLVVPSLGEEALGVVVMEAKEAAIPAVVFPRGGLPEMIDHGVDGFVCCEPSVEALEEGLRYYLDDPSRARQHGQAAHASLIRLGIQDFATKWLAVYGGRADVPSRLGEEKVG